MVQFWFFTIAFDPKAEEFAYHRNHVNAYLACEVWISVISADELVINETD